MSTEKPFPPSAKRLKKLQSEGNVVRCRTVTQASGWIFIALSYTAIISLEFLWELIQCIENGGGAAGIQRSIDLALKNVAYVISVGLGLPGLLNVFIELFQARWSYASKVLRISPDRLNVVSGFKRFGKSLRTFPGAALRFGLAFCSLGFVLCGIAQQVPELVAQNESVIMYMARGWGTVIWGWFAVLLICSAAVEYCAARRRYLRDNGMSLEELRREHKDDEGDPHIRAERRSLHEWLARGDLKERVVRSKFILMSRKSKNEKQKRS